MTVLGINLFDLICVALLAIFSIRGLFHGVLEEAAALFGLFLGFVLANRYLADVLGWLEGVVSHQEARLVLAYLIIFAGSIVVASLLARILRKVLQISFASWLDHMAGAVLGAAKGLVLCLLLYMGAQFLAPNSDFLKGSVCEPYIAQVLTLIMSLLPNIIHNQGGVTWPPAFVKALPESI